MTTRRLDEIEARLASGVMRFNSRDLRWLASWARRAVPLLRHIRKDFAADPDHYPGRLADALLAELDRAAGGGA